MRLSWQIQKDKKISRSKALLAAWAIILNEDITVYHLVQKLSAKPVKKQVAKAYSLFE